MAGTTTQLRQLITDTAATVQRMAQRQEHLAAQVDHLHERLFVANGKPPLVVQVDSLERSLAGCQAACRRSRSRLSGFALDVAKALAPAALVGLVAWGFWVNREVSARGGGGNQPPASQPARP